jgi:poly-gamma-glutamate capsule biosynthesis protein CapA/YwtB (metallophosphatase superfamily)
VEEKTIQRTRKIHYRWVVITIVALIIIAGGVSLSATKKQVPVSRGTVSQIQKTAVDPYANRIRVLLAGDFIAHDSVNTQAKQADGSYNYLPLMNDFVPVFHAADIRFCHDANLNGGSAFTIGGYPKFNSPTEFVRDMGKVGCNMVATGSNHSFDRNQDAINASIDAWQQVPEKLAVVGQNHNQTEHDTVSYFSIKGVKMAFLAYTTYLNLDAPAQNNYGVNVYSQDFAAAQIKAAKDNGAKLIITSIRWGTEYSPDVTLAQKQVAQFLSDQGVDLIIGHGSHVLEPVAQISSASGKKTLVWYSIGNFINTQEPPETLFNGLPIIDYDRNTLQVTAIKFLPIYQHYEWTAAQASADSTNSRNNVHMYLLENATQNLLDTQQLHTTIAAQRQRISTTLNLNGLTIPLITSKQYYDE